MKYDFIPLSDPVLAVNYDCQQNLDYSVVELHSKVKEHMSPNFNGARITIPSQLNIPDWKYLLSEYLDQQLLQFLGATVAEWPLRPGFDPRHGLKWESW